MSEKGKGLWFCQQLPMAGSQVLVVNYLSGLIFLPLLDYKLLRNRNYLTHFCVSCRPQSTHYRLSVSIHDISVGHIPDFNHHPHLLLSLHPSNKQSIQR